MVGSEPCLPVGLALSCDNVETAGAVVPATGEVVVAGDGATLMLVPIIGATLENETGNSGAAL
jgi:hypothetical protein